ncbi:MAG TPA: ATP-binding protein [Bacteroidota bacterium]|nr:ATP-binding protein [Bacteroidota bacterium]
MRKYLHTLSFRVLSGSLILLFVLFALFAYYAIRFHNDQIMKNVIENASGVSDLIKNSTRYSMMLNRKEDVYQIISTIAREPGVEGIRIYNKRGEIMFSTNKSEQGTVVDLHAEACTVCHEQSKPLHSLSTVNRERIYDGPDGHRILGLINPIPNESSCANNDCHAHPPEQTVLGVLDVRMSLARVDSQMHDAQIQFIIYASIAVILVCLASLAFLYQVVLRPVKLLTRGIREISSGNLAYHLSIASRDEIGQLSSSFNAMATSLKSEEQKNLQWSEELEKRIREKTEELSRIHEQILQIEKMASLGKLSATVAHELNNPLEGILTYAKLIAKRIRKISDTPERWASTLEELDLIINETTRCGTIVKNLLLFSRKQVGEFALVPVKQIVDRAALLMQHHFHISNIRFVTNYEDESVIVMGDEQQIQQALVALFVNAVEAMPDGGTLSVNTGRDAATGRIRIEVCDTGIGITPDDILHIYEPFFTKKKNGNGVGLGLSVVYGIVERHGGTIAVASEVGKGTTFTLSFPSHHQPISHGTSQSGSQVT